MSIPDTDADQHQEVTLPNPHSPEAPELSVAQQRALDRSSRSLRTRSSGAGRGMDTELEQPEVGTTGVARGARVTRARQRENGPGSTFADFDLVAEYNAVEEARKRSPIPPETREVAAKPVLFEDRTAEEWGRITSDRAGVWIKLGYTEEEEAEAMARSLHTDLPLNGTTLADYPTSVLLSTPDSKQPFSLLLQTRPGLHALIERAVRERKSPHTFSFLKKKVESQRDLHEPESGPRTARSLRPSDSHSGPWRFRERFTLLGRTVARARGIHRLDLPWLDPGPLLGYQDVEGHSFQIRPKKKVPSVPLFHLGEPGMRDIHFVRLYLEVAMGVGVRATHGTQITIPVRDLALALWPKGWQRFRDMPVLRQTVLELGHVALPWEEGLWFPFATPYGIPPDAPLDHEVPFSVLLPEKDTSGPMIDRDWVGKFYSESTNDPDLQRIHVLHFYVSLCVYWDTYGTTKGKLSRKVETYPVLGKSELALMTFGHPWGIELAPSARYRQYRRAKKAAEFVIGKIQARVQDAEGGCRILPPEEHAKAHREFADRESTE